MFVIVWTNKAGRVVTVSGPYQSESEAWEIVLAPETAAIGNVLPLTP